MALQGLEWQQSATSPFETIHREVIAFNVQIKGIKFDDSFSSLPLLEEAWEATVENPASPSNFYV